MEIVGINDYLESKRAKTTRSSISTILNDFIRFTTSCEKGKEEENSIAWIKSQPDIFLALRNYVNYLNNEANTGHLAPMTVNGRFNTVNNWLAWNGISIGDREIAVLKSALPRKIMVGEDACISRSTIQTILHHSDIQMKALILVLCSSGMRINEVLGLQYADFADKEISEIRIPRQKMKAGAAHRYYFSAEALQAVSEYLKVRDTIRKRGEIRTKNMNREYKNDTLFGMSATTAGVKFHRIQVAAGVYEYDPEGKQAKITFHSLRKWMESTAKLYQPINIVDAIIGHNEALTKHYRRYTPEQLRDAYAIIEPHICIEAPADYAELQGETQTSLKKQQETTAALAAKMLAMEQEMKELRAIIKSAEE